MTALTERFPGPSPTPPDVRLVVVDMDGTLLDPEHRLPPGLGPLLDALARRGIAFCPASGRQHATLVRQLADVTATDDLVVIAENGSYVARGGRELSSVTLSRDVVDDVVRTVRGLAAAGVAASAIVCGKRSAWVERGDPAFLEEARRYYALLEQVDDLLTVDDEVLKVAVFDAGSAADRTAPVLERFADTHRVVLSGRHWVDIMDPAVTKGVAVRALQDRLGLTAAHTMAFGDYLNDVEMLDAAEWSFAVSNAHPAVRARARYLAPSNADDGVVRTLRAVLHLDDAAGHVRDRPVSPAAPQLSPTERVSAGPGLSTGGSDSSSVATRDRWDQWNGEQPRHRPPGRHT